MTTVRILQYLDEAPPALIGEVLREEGLRVQVLRADRPGLPTFAVESCQGLVVLGGVPTAPSEAEAPAVAAVMAQVRAALAAQTPLIGVCTGAHLLALAGGGRSYPGSGASELGWYPVRMTPAGVQDPLCRHLLDTPETPRPPETPVLLWHSRTFDPPPGAAHLASSASFPHQAFRIGAHAWGFQFHFELTAPLIEHWTVRWADDLRAAGVAPEQVLADTRAHLEGLQARGTALLRAFARLVREQDSPGPVG